MNLRTLRGETFSYLGNADALPLALLDHNLNLAQWSVYRRTRASRYWQTVREKFIALTAGKDVVELGDDVDSVVAVYRLDVGGSRVYPLNARREEEADRLYDEQPAYSYQPLAGARLRLLEVPETSSTDASKDGLRLKYRPRPVPLVSDDQEPDLPEALHEAIVVRAIERLRLKEGVALVSPQQFEAFRRRVDAELDSYLVPSFEDDTHESPDTWGFYETEGSL